jgi:hypothetical protein
VKATGMVSLVKTESLASREVLVKPIENPEDPQNRDVVKKLFKIESIEERQEKLMDKYLFGRSDGESTDDEATYERILSETKRREDLSVDDPFRHLFENLRNSQSDDEASS